MTQSIRRMLLIAGAGAALCLPISPPPAAAQDSAAKPDNSAQNRNQDQTAQNQSNAKSDRETTAKVRRALMADKNLSTYGHNIKIVTRNGQVTLKGPVMSGDEKQKVESDVAGVISRDSMIDQLTVKE